MTKPETRKIKLDISFTKDLKDRIIMYVPGDLKLKDFPFKDFEIIEHKKTNSL